MARAYPEFPGLRLAVAALVDPEHQAGLARMYERDAARWLNDSPPSPKSAVSYWQGACEAWARSALAVLGAFA